jgi:hypothetical protein
MFAEHILLCIICFVVLDAHWSLLLWLLGFCAAALLVRLVETNILRLPVLQTESDDSRFF